MIDLGCFGLPSAYNGASAACGACPARTDCKSRALAILERVRASVRVEEKITEIRVGYAVTPDVVPGSEIDRANGAPKKIAARLRSLLQKGFHRHAMSMFAHGDNPFPVRGAKHMHVAGELLLANGFDRTLLRNEFQRRFGWTQTTAASEVSNAIALLNGLGLIQQVGKWISLPNFTEKNKE